jgi:hypothetical protein
MKKQKQNRTWVFRPVDYNYRIKDYYAHMPRGPHWRVRLLSGSRFGSFKYRVFQIIHHYSGHAPAAVAKGWKKAAARQDIRFGKNGGSRFMNKYTAHSYL